MLASKSFPQLGIDDEGDRSVIDQIHLHIGAEFTGRHGIAQIQFQPLNKSFVERNGNGRRGGTGVGRPVALARAGEQRELADDQNITADLLNAAVHQALLIGKDSQPDDFAAQPLDVLSRVSFLDGQQYEQTMADLAFDGVLDGDGSAADSLNNGSHAGFILSTGTRFERNPQR